MPRTPEWQTVCSNPRVAAGCFIAWKDGKVLSWGRMGSDTYPREADTVDLNPADYERLKQYERRADDAPNP